LRRHSWFAGLVSKGIPERDDLQLRLQLIKRNALVTAISAVSPGNSQVVVGELHVEIAKGEINAPRQHLGM